MKTFSYYGIASGVAIIIAAESTAQIFGWSLLGLCTGCTYTLVKDRSGG